MFFSDLPVQRYKEDLVDFDKLTSVVDVVCAWEFVNLDDQLWHLNFKLGRILEWREIVITKAYRIVKTKENRRTR